MIKESVSSSEETILQRAAQHQNRWSAYGETAGILSLSEKLSAAELKRFSIFQEYEDSFLETMSPDVTVAVWKKDAVLYEEGTYIDMAFFIVSGDVDLYLGGLEERNIEATAIVDRERTMILSSAHAPKPSAPSLRPSLSSETEITFLADMNFNLPRPGEGERGRTVALVSGDIFGEIGALSGWTQTATARTGSECTLVQIRLPAVRAMKRKSPAFKTRLDRLYRERALSAHLMAVPMLRNLRQAAIEAVKEVVDLISCAPGESVVREGDRVDAIYLVRSGFLSLVQRFGTGTRGVSYLSRGMLLGDVEFVAEKLDRWEATAISVEHSELVKIPWDTLKNLIRTHPALEDDLWQTAVARIKEVGQNKQDSGRSEFIQTALNTGLVQGSSMMTVDLSVCTRCDDCVRACAATHNNVPRFIREGNKYATLLIAKSCYHCMDPVCLVGCPTGAIRRAGTGNVVEINPQICIGCGTCAKSCPYDSIVMHETGEVWPENMVPAFLRGKNRQMASKCNLCHDTGHGPACVSNCPQECLVRVGSVEGFQERLSTSKTPEVMSPSGKLLKKNSLFTFWQKGFIGITFASLGVFLLNGILSEFRPSNLWGLSYGVAATLFLIAPALLGLRRRTLRFSTRWGLGKAATWRSFHLYSGTLFFLFLLMHSGFRLPKGGLNGWIWGLSLWTVVSGGVGFILQKWIPKLLSALSIEVLYNRIPELIQDLEKRAEAIAATCGEAVQQLYKRELLPLFTKPIPRLIYYMNIAGHQAIPFRKIDYLKGLLASEEKGKLEELLALCKVKIQMDAHYTLQRTLRYWLYIHLPPSVLLLILVVIHLFFVVYY